MYGQLAYPDCPKAQKEQNDIAKLRLKRSQAKRQWYKDSLTRRITRSRSRRDRELLKCRQAAAKKGVVLASDAAAAGFDPYAEQQMDIVNGGMVNGQTFQSGMTADTGDYKKLILSMGALGLLIAGGIAVTRRLDK